MEQVYFGERIASHRKAIGLTQEALAQRLGVTNQAVSKWESDQCCPDIMLIPALADAFGISIDELFGRAPRTGAEGQPEIMELPWPDDGDLRAACFVGHRLADRAEASGARSIDIGRFMNIRLGGGSALELHFSGSVQDIHAAGDVVCHDSVIHGSVYAEEGVACGDVEGSVTAGDEVNCGNVSGNVDAGDSVCCGNVGGSVQAGDSISCGNIAGNASAGDSIRGHGINIFYGE